LDGGLKVRIAIGEPQIMIFPFIDADKDACGISPLKKIVYSKAADRSIVKSGCVLKLLVDSLLYHVTPLIAVVQSDVDEQTDIFFTLQKLLVL
jgi:hypothetical protein